MRGFAAVPELGKGYSSNGRENPDWIVYERSQKEIYTMVSRGKSASVTDTATNKVVATIPLEGKPETAMVDATPASGRSTWRISTRSSSTRRPAVLEVVQTIKTVCGARTMTLDPPTRIIYLAATDDEPQAPGSMDRPKAVAGSFRVLTRQTK